MKNLTITIVQSEIIWHDAKANLSHLENIIKRNYTHTDLIILPEMFNTGFTMKPSDAGENMNGAAVSFLRRMAKEINADITGSIAIKENGLFYNRLVWAKPGGELFTSDKRHLFRMGGEDKVYSPGNSHLTVDLNGWKIRPFICYDLRFPVWSRNYALQYDLAIYPANWPAKRDFHWETLLRARAIENQCYVAGINRTGSDGNGIVYNGKSAVIDFCGNGKYTADESESVSTVELSHEELLSYRESFPAWKDGDEFTLSGL